MKINYLDIIVKKDIQIDELKKRIEDKEYEIGLLQLAHDGIQLRERHQNGEIRDLQERYNKMTDMCKIFEKEKNSLHSFKDYIESRLTKEQLEQIYKEAEEEVYDIKKELHERGSDIAGQV